MKAYFLIEQWAEDIIELSEEEYKKFNTLFFFEKLNFIIEKSKRDIFFEPVNIELHKIEDK